MADTPQPASGKKLTKNEAVRLALIALGEEAGRVEVQEFVKKEFGIEMNLDHVSTAKAMAARKLKEEAEAKKPPESAPVATKEKAPAEKITKIEGIRRAIHTLGEAATTSELQSFVKEQFNFDMSDGHVKNARSVVLKRGAKKKSAKKQAAKKEPAPKAAVQPPPPVPVATSIETNGIAMDDILQLKGLVGRIGADDLRTLIGVLGK